MCPLAWPRFAQLRKWARKNREKIADPSLARKRNPRILKFPLSPSLLPEATGRWRVIRIIGVSGKVSLDGATRREGLSGPLRRGNASSLVVVSRSDLSKTPWCSFVVSGAVSSALPEAACLNLRQLLVIGRGPSSYTEIVNSDWTGRRTWRRPELCTRSPRPTRRRWLSRRTWSLRKASTSTYLASQPGLEQSCE
jgi:hypothetical protein